MQTIFCRSKLSREMTNLKGIMIMFSSLFLQSYLIDDFKVIIETTIRFKKNHIYILYNIHNLLCFLPFNVFFQTYLNDIKVISFNQHKQYCKTITGTKCFKLDL